VPVCFCSVVDDQLLVPSLPAQGAGLDAHVPLKAGQALLMKHVAAAQQHLQAQQQTLLKRAEQAPRLGGVAGG
jgi:K+-transporting ATPase c subunit